MEGLYRDKVPYSWYVKNSKNKPLFKKSVTKKNVYDKFMQIINYENLGKREEAFKTLKEEATDYFFPLSLSLHRYLAIWVEKKDIILYIMPSSFSNSPADSFSI